MHVCLVIRLTFQLWCRILNILLQFTTTLFFLRIYIQRKFESIQLISSTRSTNLNSILMINYLHAGRAYYTHIMNCTLYKQRLITVTLWQITWSSIKTLIVVNVIKIAAEDVIILRKEEEREREREEWRESKVTM